MGRFGNYPPWDPEGFLAFAKGLHTPKLNDFITDAAQAEDIEVQRLVTEVLNLAKPLSTLQEKPLRSRVEAYKRRY